MSENVVRTDVGTLQGDVKVDGTLTVAKAATLSGSLEIQGIGAVSHVTGVHASAGANLADDTDEVTLVSGDFGKTFVCLLDGAAKTVNLPASVTASDIGKSVKIYQAVDLVASGVLTLKTNTDNTLAANTVFVGSAVTVRRPSGAANTKITITGADTNSAFGAGSTITATVVAAGKYCVEIICNNLGTGSDGIAVADS